MFWTVAKILEWEISLNCTVKKKVSRFSKEFRKVDKLMTQIKASCIWLGPEVILFRGFYMKPKNLPEQFLNK